VLAYLAPALLGAGPAALGDAGVGTMGAIERLHVEEVRRVGADLVVDAVPAGVAGDRPAIPAGSADATAVVASATAGSPAWRGGTG
jgi:diaminohydroxyphosphoribosylaminopyrimidine deaminase/5-amino-6-(5-phosphoribosylamino)uracil reductase